MDALGEQWLAVENLTGRLEFVRAVCGVPVQGDQDADTLLVPKRDSQANARLQALRVTVGGGEVVEGLA